MREGADVRAYRALSEALAPFLDGLHDLEAEEVRIALYAYAGGEEPPPGLFAVAALYDAARIAAVRAGVAEPVPEHEAGDVEDPLERAFKLIARRIDGLQHRLDWTTLEDVALRAVRGAAGRPATREEGLERWREAFRALNRWYWSSVEQEVLKAFGVEPEDG